MARDRATAKPKRSQTPYTTPKDSTIFYLQKKRVAPTLQAILTLQQRDDTSGKFTRKLGQQRRALTVAAEHISEERFDLVKKFGEKYPQVYPATLPGTDTPHPQAGQPHPNAGEYTPVYATEEGTGKPLFKKDSAGNDTAERVVLPDNYNIGDPVGFDAAVKELFEEFIAVECPAFLLEPAGPGSTPELDMFKNIKGAVTDPLYDLEQGAPTTKKPDNIGPALKVEDGGAKTDGAAAPEPDRTAP